MKDRKHDNAGMTLLEVVVAVAIFSIAAIILMQGFVTSGRINRKSNLYLEATSTAQNVMEELKAKDFEETALAFNYPLDLTFSGGGFSRFHFLEDEAGRLNQRGGITVKELIQNGEDESYSDAKLLADGGKEGDPSSAAILSEDEGRTYTFHPKESGNYYFEILNLPNLHETFDVLVEFNGEEYKKTPDADGEMNEYELPQIARLDNVRNGFLAMDEVWGGEAGKTAIVTEMLDPQWKYVHDVMYFKDKRDWEDAHPLLKDDGEPYRDENGETIPDPAQPFQENEPQPISFEQFREQVDRKLIIELSEDNQGIITAKSHYIYKAFDCVDNTQPDCKYATFSHCPCNGAQTGEGDCFCTRESEPETFFTSQTNADLENLYLFYYPNYKSTGGKILDSIEFVNKINHPVNLYIAKQKKDGDDLAANENSYKMSLNVKENPGAEWYTNLELFQAKTLLRTDLNTNISEPHVSAREIVPGQIAFSYEGSGLTVSGSDAEKVLVTKGLENKEQRDRIYKVTVSVYKQGARERNFAEEPIVQLEGSRED